MSNAGPSLEDFRAWLGQDCEVAVAEHRLPMTLIGAKAFDGSPRAGGGFELEFLGPVEPLLAQGLMRVSGPAAAHDIFLVPCARDAAGTRYAATFF